MRSVIVGAYDKYVFNFIRNYQNVHTYTMEYYSPIKKIKYCNCNNMDAIRNSHTK